MSPLLLSARWRASKTSFKHQTLATSIGSLRLLSGKPFDQLATYSVGPYPGHVPLSRFQNAFLAIGSATVSLADPKRADMVAALAETTAGASLTRLRDAMLASEEGRRILKERPRVNSTTVDLERLARYDEGTFGRAYVSWLGRCGVTPDTREPVRYISDPELAYVMQRYRECHDFYHCIVDLPVSVEYEIALKIFEYANLGLPMMAIAALAGPIRLNSAKRKSLMEDFLPWALKCGGSSRCLMTVYWEERWGQNVEDVKAELGLWDAPAARWRKPLREAARNRTNVGRIETFTT